MKRIFALGLIFLFIACSCSADQWVNGYYRKNGTYVKGYWRSDPDNTDRNNYSTKGNVNPYTGKKGYKEPSNDSIYKFDSESSEKTCYSCNGTGKCSSCRGSGGKDRCWSCNGSGENSYGYKCSSCNGTGYKSCYSCSGTGRCNSCKGTGKIKY